MVEPRIQYAKTEDGISIAYGTVGAGPAIVVPHAIFEQFSLAWQMPEWRRYLEQLGEDRQLVMYDGRGFGLSERETDDFSLETKLRDMEAVIGATKLRRFALFAFMFAGSTAIAYAARYPRQVTRLILYGTYSEPVFSAEQVDAVIALCRTDWRTASQLLADSTTREEYSDSALAIAEHWRQATTGEIVAKRLSQRDRADVTDLLSQVRVPTLFSTVAATLRLISGDGWPLQYRTRGLCP